MDVVKLPKKVRMVCYEIMDGKEEALDTLESFAGKYPHQVAAVKAEVAYFNMDYEKALALDLTAGAGRGADQGTGTYPGGEWSLPAGPLL